MSSDEFERSAQITWLSEYIAKKAGRRTRTKVALKVRSTKKSKMLETDIAKRRGFNMKGVFKEHGVACGSGARRVTVEASKEDFVNAGGEPSLVKTVGKSEFLTTTNSAFKAVVEGVEIDNSDTLQGGSCQMLRGYRQGFCAQGHSVEEFVCNEANCKKYVIVEAGADNRSISSDDGVKVSGIGGNTGVCGKQERWIRSRLLGGREGICGELNGIIFGAEVHKHETREQGGDDGGELNEGVRSGTKAFESVKVCERSDGVGAGALKGGSVCRDLNGIGYSAGRQRDHASHGVRGKFEGSDDGYERRS